MISCVLRQIYKRLSQRRPTTIGERWVARDLLAAQDNSTDFLNLISRIALTVASISGDTVEEQKRLQGEYAVKHHLLLASFAGVLTREEAHNVGALAEGMLRILQLLHKRLSRERLGEWLVASLDAGGGKVHRFPKGGQQPDTMYSILFGGITTDPAQVLGEKLTQWCGIWKCNDAAAR